MFDASTLYHYAGTFRLFELMLKRKIKIEDVLDILGNVSVAPVSK
jgi:hypothetical protein